MKATTSAEQGLRGRDDRLSRSGAMGLVRSNRRRNHEIRVAPEVCRLEDRCLLSTRGESISGRSGGQCGTGVVHPLERRAGDARCPVDPRPPLPVGRGRDEDHHAHQQRPGDGLSFHPRREHRSRSQRHFSEQILRSARRRRGRIPRIHRISDARSARSSACRRAPPLRSRSRSSCGMETTSSSRPTRTT